MSLGQKKKTGCYIGTSGWSYNHWKGSFYPTSLKNDQMLGYYCERFSTTEINNSFYHLPQPKTLKHWNRTVPEDFVFTAKGSRFITHMKKLKDPANSVAAFLDRISLLDDKLGPLLFQLPPNWRCNAQRLAQLLDTLSRDFEYAFEFRDHSWHIPEVYDLLAKHNAAFCLYELDGFVSPKPVTAEFIYIRLHGPDGAYQGDYDGRTLAGWATRIANWQQDDKRVYCYFDNDEAGYAAQNAGKLQKQLQKRLEQ